MVLTYELRQKLRAAEGVGQPDERESGGGHRQRPDEGSRNHAYKKNFDTKIVSANKK
jgi:hypothetical protein